MTVFTETSPGRIFTFTGREDIFDTLYGIPVAPVGEECEGLLALGHLADRHVQAVTNAYHRRVWGHRILPSRELDDLTESGSRHAWILTTRGCGDPFEWEYSETDAGTAQAQPVTLIDVEWLAHEDVAVQSECPACGKPSRSTGGAIGSGRAGWSSYHRCRGCGHQWPPAPSYPLTLNRGRTWPIGRDGICFACHCLPDFPCRETCTISPDPVIGQLLCTRCRAQHSPDMWQQLAAVAYGTARQTDSRDDRRDRWLYSEALRGTPPAHAAREWTRRVHLTARRATTRTPATA